MTEGEIHHDEQQYTYRHIPDLAVLEVGQLSILSEHGLGYGVDMTNENPWKNCGPLKAREIKEKGDVKQKIEEGAFSQYYHEIKSRESTSLRISTTLAAVEYIKMGIHAKTSSSVDYTLLAVGSQIHTRTIDFDMDKCSSPTLTAFEELLMERLKNEGLDAKFDEQKVKMMCRHVVEAYRCTHYIRALTLGAAEYEVLTAEDFKRVYSVAGEVNLKDENIGVGTAGGFSRIVEKRRKKQKYRQIGGWMYKDDKYTVDDERVIAVEIAPIHTLVKTRELRDALTEAVKEYEKEKLQQGCKFIDTLIRELACIE